MPVTASRTVSAYLASLPAERRSALEAVRRVIKRYLPAGYEETVTGRMITYVVPLAAYSTTYNGHPLWYVALSLNKRDASLHLLAAYGSAELTRRLQEGFRRAGKRLNMGKACIRFTTPDDLALDVVGDVIASVPMSQFIAIAEAARTGRGTRRAAAGRLTNGATRKGAGKRG